METVSRYLLTFLLNSLWQIPLAAAVAALACRLMRNGPASHRHAAVAVPVPAAPVPAAATPVPTAVEPDEAENDDRGGEGHAHGRSHQPQDD